MNRHTLGALGFATVMLAATAEASAPKVRQADLLDRAVAVWAKVRTVRATFEQTITNALTGRTLTAKGEYQQQRPGKLAVLFADPANDRIVADGKSVWLYLPSSAPDQVMKSALGADGTGTVDLTAQFLMSPRTKYNITTIGAQVVSGRPTFGYTLTPKNAASAPFQVASVWIDSADATIRQFEVTERSGVQRKVRLLTLKTNVPVESSAFVFTPPKGVRVIER